MLTNSTQSQPYGWNWVEIDYLLTTMTRIYNTKGHKAIAGNQDPAQSGRVRDDVG